MLTMLLLIGASHLGTADDLAPRIETLKFHLERMGEITVEQALTDEKAARLEELRKAFDAGIPSVEAYEDLYRKMDAVREWLWANSAQPPYQTKGDFLDTADTLTLGNGQLELRLDKATLSMVVKTAKETWSFAKSNDRDVELPARSFSLASAQTKSVAPFNPGYAVSAIIRLGHFPQAAGLTLDFTINLIGSEIVFEIAAPTDNIDIEAINWPKPIELPNSPDVLSVLPHMQGMLLPGNWDQDIHQTELVNSRTLYMPWWGQIRNGHGVLTILETSDDAGVAYDHVSGGPTVIQPRWHSSMKRVSYLRTVRYVFDDEATYVTMAKRYRKYVKETGRFVSLVEKRVRTPALNEVIGRPVIHIGALYHFVKEASLFNKETIEANHALVTFDQLTEALKGIKARGLKDAYVHLDGWGFYGYDNGHPDVLPPGEEQGGWEGLRRFADTCDELGYLFAVHDQYRDFYKNAASYDDRLALLRKDGTRPYDSTWCGGPQTVLNPRFAPEYVRRNHDLFAKHGIKVKGAYLDVFSVVPLEESYEPAHPVTRSQCAEYRRDCFDLLRARGYVVSSEEPTDYLIPSLDLVHHGPYPTYPRFGGGDARGIPAPLFNLVYHDSILLPWEMGEDGGWGIPKGDSGRLHCMLNAGLPYIGPGAPESVIAEVQEVADLALKLGCQEMVNHEFLSPDRRIQRATYADGTTVTVDFKAKTVKVDPSL